MRGQGEDIILEPREVNFSKPWSPGFQNNEKTSSY